MRWDGGNVRGAMLEALFREATTEGVGREEYVSGLGFDAIFRVHQKKKKRQGDVCPPSPEYCFALASPWTKRA